MSTGPKRREGAAVSRVLITGVRGKTGAPLARRLIARGDVDVLGGSSDPSTVALRGVRPTALSWDDPATWPAATEDVDAVFVVRPDRLDAPQLVAGLLDGAPRTARVVLLSGQEADACPPDPWALAVEEAVRASGRAWTVLRPSWFMQVLGDPRFFRDDVLEGELAFPSAGASVAWTDTRDIAAVAERALLEPGHAGRTYALSGPQALTLPQTARLLSQALGRPVAHRDITVDEAVRGLEGFDRDVTAATFERVRAGVYGEVADTVERVTGLPARSLQTYLREVWPVDPPPGPLRPGRAAS